MSEESLTLLGYLADEIVRLSESNGKSGKGMLLMLHYMFMVFGEQNKIDIASLDSILKVIEERLGEFNVSEIKHPKDDSPSAGMLVH